MVSKKELYNVAKNIRVEGETINSALKRAKKVIEDSPEIEFYKWNDNPYIRKSHNCYSYFLNKLQKGPIKSCKKRPINERCLKPQPGYYAGEPTIRNRKKYTCKNMTKRVLKDSKFVHLTEFDKNCPKDYYMGALVVHPGKTYHFYRRDKNGLWSHKDGSAKVSLVDADFKLIKNPKFSNQKFSDKKYYSDFCNYFCIPNDRNKKFMRHRPRTLKGGKTKRKKRNTRKK